MKVIPHGLEFTGFFEKLSVGNLATLLQDFSRLKADYFSMGTTSGILRCHCKLLTREESVSPDGFDENVLAGFLDELRKRPWTSCRVKFEHGTLISPGELHKVEPYRGEIFCIKIDREEGTCDIQCRLRERSLTEKFVKKVIAELNLLDRPKKHSRDISQLLETKLLCDSMHMCNVCRQEGVIIHHIEAVEDGGKTIEENLIVLCLTHHRQAHSKSQLAKNLRPVHLREYKKRHAIWVTQQGTNTPVGEVAPLPSEEPNVDQPRVKDTYSSDLCNS